MPDCRLPAELLRPIFASVSKRTLCSLCLVSRLFRSEAVQILYQSVEMPDKDEIATRWWTTIINNAQLALLVKSLKVSVSNKIWDEWSQAPTVEFDRVYAGLSALNHLCELDLEVPDPPETPLYDDEGRTNAFYGVLATCSFRLRRCTLRNDIASMSSLLANQPEIRDFTLEYPIFHHSQFGPNIMPYLTTIDTAASLIPFFTTPRPLRCARLHFPNEFDAHQEREVLSYLETVKGTLQSLRVDRQAYSQTQWSSVILMPPDHLVANLAQRSPDLKYFCLMDDSLASLGEGDVQEMDDFVAAFSQFASLETLVLDVYSCKWWLMHDAPIHDCTVVAARLIRACTSLKTVILPAWDKGPTCYVRSSCDNVTTVEAGDGIRADDEDYWRHAA